MRVRWSSLAVIALLAAAVAPALAKSERRVTIAVTTKGFVPASVKVKRGQAVTLVVTRKTDRTCAKELVMKEHGIHQALPLNRAVEIRFTPTHFGTVAYACPMDMIKGEVVVE